MAARNDSSRGERDASTLSQLKLTVNCDRQSPTCAPSDPPSTVAIEAIANTTPVVLDIPFYPLGREPRLFDAFYLASPEAFSKTERVRRNLLSTRGWNNSRLLGRAARHGAADPLMLFGVGKDGNLHRLRPEADTSLAVPPTRARAPAVLGERHDSDPSPLLPAEPTASRTPRHGVAYDDSCE